MVPALVARTGVLFAVVTFCMAVCALAAWLAVDRPGSELLSADTRSALAAGYGPDQHVLTQPPLDTAINQAAQNDAGGSSQAPPADSKVALPPSLPTPAPEPGTLKRGGPTLTPKSVETGTPSNAIRVRSNGAPTPTTIATPGVSVDFIPTPTPFRTPRSHGVANPSAVHSNREADAHAPPDGRARSNAAGANASAAHAPAADALGNDADPRARAHAHHSDITPSSLSPLPSPVLKTATIGLP